MTARGKKNGELRVLVVGVGNMGASHARAYDEIEGFELAGLCARQACRAFADYGEALETLNKVDVRASPRALQAAAR